MTKDELIAKQQLEIEELKIELSQREDLITEARRCLWRPEQWNPKCPDFPKVAMTAIVRARDILTM